MMSRKRKWYWAVFLTTESRCGRVFLTLLPSVKSNSCAPRTLTVWFSPGVPELGGVPACSWTCWCSPFTAQGMHFVVASPLTQGPSCTTYHLENTGISSKPKCWWSLSAEATHSHQLSPTNVRHTPSSEPRRPLNTGFWRSPVRGCDLECSQGPSRHREQSAEGKLLLQKSGTRAGGGQSYQLFPGMLEMWNFRGISQFSKNWQRSRCLRDCMGRSKQVCEPKSACGDPPVTSGSRQVGKWTYW